MWGIIPAAGSGSRIQPLAFSKELLPVGSRCENGAERPRAISEYLVERMIAAGASRLCFIISPTKADILQYYGSRLWGVDIAYTVQPAPGGLCDAVFRAAPLIHPDDAVLIGLPDTIWFPSDALSLLPDGVLALLLFPVTRPELFDAVSTDEQGRVREIHVKQRTAPSQWIWGAMKMPGRVFHALHQLWLRPERGDEYLGTLINAWLNEGGEAIGTRAGCQYVDTGTLDGYRAAMRLLEDARNSEYQPASEHISEKEVSTTDEFTTADRH
ncbi:sugar phosphate nucleotidyltransferase [Occallatibacter riparius]|uniref:glucose-1-phosphate thymidylyltransferase n=1 Tax=Occallatibacter riparius TaxID=1002689 RepID=A0A9J7BY21_9BACT|nr:sugar phosphate nucleotidyltransferase [Occallatibacter riparius]UWZ86954.1 nucleotidyltransferase family protein [Occallatibacter riparius]